jgi:16S rRNA (guanine(966)-N(2))-methyltransferase RsmD
VRNEPKPQNARKRKGEEKEVSGASDRDFCLSLVALPHNNARISARQRQNLKSPGTATPDHRSRERNLFNILGARVVDANVLDLFAGAGSVGIEALSRGARHATFVELDREALRAIRKNLELTRLYDRARIVREDVFRFIRKSAGEKYDLVYIAPPQYKELWSEALKTLDGRGLLSERGIIVAQIHPKEFRAFEFTEFVLADQRKYGSTMLCFYGSAHKIS